MCWAIPLLLPFQDRRLSAGCAAPGRRESGGGPGGSSQNMVRIHGSLIVKAKGQPRVMLWSPNFTTRAEGDTNITAILDKLVPIALGMVGCPLKDGLQAWAASSSFNLLDSSGAMIQMNTALEFSEPLRCFVDPGDKTKTNTARLFLVAKEHAQYLHASYLPRHGRPAVGPPRLENQLSHVSDRALIATPAFAVWNRKIEWDDGDRDAGAIGAGGGGGAEGGGESFAAAAAAEAGAAAKEKEKAMLAFLNGPNDDIFSAATAAVPEKGSGEYCEAAGLGAIDSEDIATHASTDAVIGEIMMYMAENPTVGQITDSMGPAMRARLEMPFDFAYMGRPYSNAFDVPVSEVVRLVEMDGVPVDPHALRFAIVRAYRSGIVHNFRARLTFDIIMKPPYLTIAAACLEHPFFCPAEFVAMRDKVFEVVRASCKHFNITYMGRAVFVALEGPEGHEGPSLA